MITMQNIQNIRSLLLIFIPLICRHQVQLLVKQKSLRHRAFPVARLLVGLIGQRPPLRNLLILIPKREPQGAKNWFSGDLYPVS